jgi:hypothetical protein
MNSLTGNNLVIFPSLIKPHEKAIVLRFGLGRLNVTRIIPNYNCF